LKSLPGSDNMRRLLVHITSNLASHRLNHSLEQVSSLTSIVGDGHVLSWTLTRLARGHRDIQIPGISEWEKRVEDNASSVKYSDMI
jgi:hypothetical protein